MTASTLVNSRGSTRARALVRLNPPRSYRIVLIIGRRLTCFVRFAGTSEPRVIRRWPKGTLCRTQLSTNVGVTVSAYGTTTDTATRRQSSYETYSAERLRVSGY